MHKVIPVLSAMAEKPFPLNRAMYRYPKDGFVQYAFGFAVILADDEIILVDTGVYSDDEFQAAASPIFKQLTTLLDNKPCLDSLKEMGIKPENVTKVIISHLHWDHAWNIDKFPNAKIYVQKKEIEGAVTPLPYERIHFGYWDGEYANPNFLKVVDRMVIVDGDKEIYPGIKVMLAPGHTRGGQIVFVDTKDGKIAILGDFANLPQGVTEDEGYPPSLLVNAEEWYKAYDRLKNENADFLLTFHDIHTYNRVYG